MLFSIRILLIFVGVAVTLMMCSEDDQDTKPVATPDTNKPNHSPLPFSVSILNIGTDHVDITWSNVVDPDSDTVYLQVFLKDQPVSLMLSHKTGFIINNLKPLQTYEGYVQATDKKSEPIKVSFSFKTKSKITVFSRIYQNIAGGEDMLVTQNGEIVSSAGLSKRDSLGNFIFYQQIDPPSYGPNYTDLIQSGDGGFLFCNRFNFQKFDNAGHHLWTSEGFDDRTVYNSLAELPDGGYLAVGNNVDVGGIIQKFNSQGKKVWRKDFGGIEFMVNCTSIVKTSDGDYVVVGSADEVQAHLSVSKIDSEGNILWVKSYSNRNYIWDAEVLQSSDGSLIIGASTIQVNNADVAWILNLSDIGDKIWEKSFSEGYGTQIWSIIELHNNDIVFVGFNELYDDSRALLAKLSHTGDLLLWKEYFPENGMDYWWMFTAVQETKDGGLIMIGGKGCVWDTCEERGSWLLKTDNEGNF